MTISNRDFCHEYAYASKEESAKNGNMSYYQGVMFSYGTALAKKFDDFTLFNRTKYSSSTSQQQALLDSALSGKTIYLKNLSRGTRFEKEDILSGLQSIFKHYSELLAKSKRLTTREKYQHEIFDIQFTIKDLLKYKILLKKDLNLELKNLMKSDFCFESLMKAKKKQEEKEKKAEQKALKKRRVELQEQVNNFRKQLTNEISLDARALICDGWDIVKLNEEKTELITAQNIRVPIDEAVKLYEVAKIVKIHGVKFKGSILQEKTTKIKNTFSVDNIDLDGNCFVGCHRFKFEEIARCYREEFLNNIEK